MSRIGARKGYERRGHSKRGNTDDQLVFGANFGGAFAVEGIACVGTADDLPPVAGLLEDVGLVTAMVGFAVEVET